PWRPRFRRGGTRLRAVLRYSLATFGSRLVAALCQQADTFVLGKISGGGVLGHYSMAKQLANLPLGKISGTANPLAAPIFAERQSDLGGLRASSRRGLRLVACITFPMSAGALLVADDLIRVALTEKWLPAVPMFDLLCVAGAVRSLDVLFPP